MSSSRAKGWGKFSQKYKNKLCFWLNLRHHICCSLIWTLLTKCVIWTVFKLFCALLMEELLQIPRTCWMFLTFPESWASTFPTKPSSTDEKSFRIIERQLCFPGPLYRVILNECRDFNNLPPLSPEATSCDFFLWGYVKDQVYVPPLPASIPELKVRIRTAIETITTEMLQTVWNELDYRVDVCRITKGAHIEHL